MKLHFPFSGPGRNVLTAGRRGFTLPELLVAITVFGFVITGVVFAHLYGLSMFRINETTLNTTDDTRKIVGRMTDEIRTCEAARIGVVSNGVFSARINGELQQGNALMIQPTTNAANFVIYFVNPADQTFRRTTSTPGSAVILAESVTNSVAFSARSFLGSVLTNNQNSVIHFSMEFFHARRFRQVADYYKLETSVTRRGAEL